MKYINTRVIASHHGGYLVQGQNHRTLNWESLVSYPTSQRAIAEIDACNKAEKFSKEVDGLVTAYNRGGYAIACFVNGNIYKR